MVLATDEVYTYAIFNYINLVWSSHTEAGGKIFMYNSCECVNDEHSHLDLYLHFKLQILWLLRMFFSIRWLFN